MYSHSEGRGTLTRNENEHAEGKYNKSNKGDSAATNTLSSIGIGTGNSNRKNAVEVMQNGDTYVVGVGGYDGTNPSDAQHVKQVLDGKQDVADNPVEAGAGTSSVQQKGRSVLALGAGAVATGEGEQISFTITSVEERGANTTAFYVQESAKGLIKGDVLHYVKGDQEIWTYVARAENNVILVNGRWEPIPDNGGSLEVLRGVAYGQNSNAENAKTAAVGDNSHSEGYLTNVRGFAAHGEGVKTHSNGWAAHSEGQETESSGISSHAEGEVTKATAKAAHAEGENTTASGEAAHAEGDSTQALGASAHAEGTGSQAKVDYSHAEGFGTEVEAVCSHAEGYLTKVNGEAAQASHAEGYSTVVNNAGEHAEGVNNVSHAADPTDPTNLAIVTRHSVGIGTPAIPEYQIPETHVNAFEIMANGDAYLVGLNSGGYNGTNAGETGVSTLQTVINSLLSGLQQATQPIIYDLDCIDNSNQQYYYFPQDLVHKQIITIHGQYAPQSGTLHIENNTFTFYY